jgi:Uma2 family endonuclease
MKQLFAQAGSAANVSGQNPLHLGDRSMPEPDVLLLAPRSDDYADSHPGPEDVLLLIEVAESSLLYDARQKLQLYARAGIAEYWLVDLVRGQIEVHRQPQGDTYVSRTTAFRQDEVSPAALPQVRIRVADIIG